MTKDEIIQAIGLSTNDFHGLCLLQRIINTTNTNPYPELIAQEKNQLVAFLEKSIGNMELNQQLLELGKLDPQDTGISFNINRMLLHLTFKSRHWHLIRFSSYEEITLAERGILADLASLVNDLAIFERMGLLHPTSLLFQIYLDAKRASDEGFAKELTASSDMVFEIKAMKGAPMVPHMNSRKDEFVLTEFLYSEEYRIKLDKLITSNEIKNYLKKHLGEDWLQQLEKKFCVLQREIHDAHIMRSFSHEPITKKVPGEDLANAHERKPTMLICSSFVGICTFAVIKELNTQLLRELKNKGAPEIFSSLLQLPISEKLKALAPADFIDELYKCHALERITENTAKF